MLSRIFAALALLCALNGYAHAQPFTKAQLNSQIAVQFPDNTVGAISPSILRTVTCNIVNSVLPTAPVVSGNLACFNGTTGLLQDCGEPPVAFGTMATQNANSVAITGGTITGLPTPINASDAATKNYVDTTSAGLTIIAPSGLATAAILPNSPTYNNGTAGVGATLTAGSNTTLTVDGTVATLGSVVLVNNQVAAAQNGIYTVTTAGSGSVAWVLTRATYFNSPATMLKGSYTFISGGVTNINSAWVLSATTTTVGTTAVNFSVFSSAPNATTYTPTWPGSATYTQAKYNANIVYMTDFMGATTCDGTTNQATNMNAFLTAVAANGAAGNASVTGVFAPGNCFVSGADPTFTVNSSTLPVNYHLIGYGTTISPDPTQFRTGFSVVRGTFVTHGDESRTIVIEGLTINAHNNSNILWGFNIADTRVSLINNNCYAGDDGSVHNQGNFACIWSHQINSTDPDTGAFYGKIINNVLKGVGTGVSAMPIGIRIDGSGGNAMVIANNNITQGNYAIRIFSPCLTVNANCAYLPSGLSIMNNDIEAFAAECIEWHTFVPSISALTGGLISGNTLEACPVGVDISTVAQASAPNSKLAIGPNTVIGGTTYISNSNGISIKTF